MAEHETTADIIAEMRKSDRDEICPWWADGGSCDLCPLGRNGKNCSFSNYADRLEAAHRRESITPKPDPDWKDICAKCKDGDIEPKHCEYYGEPNGCNSPVYGEHPTAEKSSAVGDAAKMREALVRFTEWYKITSIRTACLRTIAETARAALAAPPRNCDKYPHDQALRIWSAEPENPMNGCFDVWLYAPATEKEGVVK